MEYKKLDGQQVLEPYISSDEMDDVLAITDMSYKFNVAPGDSKMVIIRSVSYTHLTLPTSDLV